MKLTIPIFILKQQARQLARAERIPLHRALDRIARGEGFRTWSQLAASWKSRPSVRALFSSLQDGELLLLGGRPGQGKTLLAIRLAVEAMRSGRRAAFFTLEFTEADVTRCFAAVDEDLDEFRSRLLLDVSDAISAAHVEDALVEAPAGTFAVIDYLQLLDQKRENPALMDQVTALRRLARERGFVIVCLSQIDRRFDPRTKSCPGLEDVRLANPLDLTLFDKACFVGRGQLRYASVSRA